MESTQRSFQAQAHIDLTGKLKLRLEQLTWMGFSANGSRLATYSRDGSIRLWDVDKAKQVLMLQDKDPALKRVTFMRVKMCPDGNFLCRTSNARKSKDRNAH